MEPVGTATYSTLIELLQENVSIILLEIELAQTSEMVARV